MVDLNIISDEIEYLKSQETSYEVCEKLAWLYVVQDHLAAEKSTTQQSVVSEFMQAAMQADTCALMRIIDEHMDAVKVVFPAEYEAVMAKVRALVR